MASWLRHPNIRSGRHRISKKSEPSEDLTRLLNDDPYQSFKAILCKICAQNATTDDILLNYLNALVKIVLRIDGNYDKTGYTIENILCCLRVLLTKDSTQIRSAGMRCIRHILKTEDDVAMMNKLLIPYLITRSLDIVLKYDIERIEVMKLMRKTLILSPSNFDISMARSLVSLANEGSEAKDRMLRICLATLSELGVLNPELLIKCGGIAAITRNLLECQTPKIAESLCGVLLLLLDKPQTRNEALIDLHSVAAPFCDFHYKHGWKDKNRRDERELRLNCSRLALLTILRSWPGILHFCGPNDRSGFRSIVEVLHLNQLEVRKAVLDLLYELMGLPQPEWTDELSVALSAVDPCEPQASWRLNEGFVAAEARSVLPHLCRTTPSTTDIHTALLLYCFLENNLLEALTEVIATSDTFISVRATVLLGELLRLIQLLLPPGCCNIAPALPALLEYATKSKPQAIGAITALQQFHKLMKKRPASYSLHLDFILRSGSVKKPSAKLGTTKKKKKQTGLKSKLHQLFLKHLEDSVKDTGVLLSNDAFTWNWNLINILLADEHCDKIDLLDTSHKTFIKRLVEFFMPSKNKYSHMDLGTSKVSLAYTTTGIQLINYLINVKHSEYGAMLLELFRDILSNIQAIKGGKSVHDCLFSPQHMVNTQCQSYFLFIGRLAATESGIELLNSIDMFRTLHDLATTTNHDCYVKLIVSSLDYTCSLPCRTLLEAILTCTNESSRLYATQFLLVLLRANFADFAKWSVQLLVKQLNDQSRSVYLSALATLHEACELPDCLAALIDLDPDLSRFGEKGDLLAVRFLASESGLNRLNLLELIAKWEGYYNYRYVKLIEGDMADALTLHQRNEDGKYDKRSSSIRSTNRKDVFLPPHLYGQLCQHPQGFELLVKHGSIESMIDCIKSANYETDDSIIKLKASLWSLGHLGSSRQGLDLLKSHNLIEQIISLAQNSQVYSVRATAFYALNLSATTKSGADELCKLDWLCTRHDRHDLWPIIKDEPYLRNTEFSEEISIGNPFRSYYDHFDTSLDEPFNQNYPADPKRLRQLTLPSSTKRSDAIIFHKRSLSESLAMDLVNNYAENYARIRNSSITESTNSTDSFINALSPIASVSSLSSTMIGEGDKSNLESQRRSITNSDTSTSSMFSGSTSARWMNRSMRLKKQFKSMFSGDHDTLVSLKNYYEPNFASAFSVQKFPMQVSLYKEEKCYMGLCLPRNLVDLFPTASDEAGSSGTVEQFDQIKAKSVQKQENLRLLNHTAADCFVCSRSTEQSSTFITSTDCLRYDVLKNIERLANPVWNRLVRQVLLQAKQKDPEIFKDLCIYSQACSMIMKNSYRLTARQFIHELFFDVSFKLLYEEPMRMFELGIS